MKRVKFERGKLHPGRATTGQGIAVAALLKRSFESLTTTTLDDRDTV